MTRAMTAEVREEEAITQREVALEVARLCRAVLTRRAQSERWTRVIVPAAATNVDLVHAGWTAGKFDLFRLVQVTREAADARARELRALGELWDATIELDRATGAL
jgi:outer membrane protein TolC